VVARPMTVNNNNPPLKTKKTSKLTKLSKTTIGGPGLASSTYNHPGPLQRPTRHLSRPIEAPRADLQPAMESYRGLLDGLVALVPTE
jgi:hypothetical protein